MFWLDCESGVSVKVSCVNAIWVSVVQNGTYILRLSLSEDDGNIYIVSKHDDEQSALFAKKELMRNIENSLKGEIK